jgi:4-amino-4-deoxy-L-arabinose transferase-like glycosyltransferase
MVGSEAPIKRLWVFFGALLLLAYFLLGLSQSFLFDVDEGAFSEATREMVVSHDWGHTTLNGADRFDKPIGVYWLQAISVKAFGVNEFAFRLPSALAAWVACLALALTASKAWGGRGAMLAAMVFASSLGPWAMARAATADGLLGLCLVLSALDLWRYLHNKDRKALRRLALWMALGVLTKGPVAVLIPAAVLILWQWWGPSPGLVLQSLRDGWSWLIFSVVAAPWYVYAWLRHGDAFIQGFFLRHNLERFSAPMEGHSGGWLYFLLVMPLLWMPWTPLAIGLFARWRQLWETPLLRFALVWTGFVVVFFSFSATKLPHYALYAAPGMVLLFTYAGVHASAGWWWACTAVLAAWLALLLLMPWALQNHPQWIADSFYRQLLQTASPPDFTRSISAAVLMVQLLWLLSSLGLPPALQLPRFGLLAMGGSTVLSLGMLPWWSQTLQAPVHALAGQAKGQSVVQWNVHMPSFALYRQTCAPRRAPEEGELALVRTDKPMWPIEWPVVAQDRGFALVLRPVGSAPAK